MDYSRHLQDTRGRNLWWEERHKELKNQLAKPANTYYRGASGEWQVAMDKAEKGATFSMGAFNQREAKVKADPEPAADTTGTAIMPFGFKQAQGEAIIRAGRLYSEEMRQFKVMVNGEEIEVSVDGELGPVTGYTWDGRMMHGESDQGVYSVGPSRRSVEWAKMTKSERIKVIQNVARQHRHVKTGGFGAPAPEQQAAGIADG
mmetsp:Transcript_29350/g.68205  ORF Transcript_29350/g.68205 Transcript_29350/m.68205 type:complete len:203 (+) Transcript_29350:49-657(+)